jgi:hypothetical protein
MLVRWKTQTRMRVVTTLARRLVTTQAARTRVVHRVVTPTLTQAAEMVTLITKPSGRALRGSPLSFEEMKG